MCNCITINATNTVIIIIYRHSEHTSALFNCEYALYILNNNNTTPVTVFLARYEQHQSVQQAALHGYERHIIEHDKQHLAVQVKS